MWVNPESALDLRVPSGIGIRFVGWITVKTSRSDSLLSFSLWERVGVRETSHAASGAFMVRGAARGMRG